MIELDFLPPDPGLVSRRAYDLHVAKKIAELNAFHTQRLEAAKLARRPGDIEARRNLARLRGELVFFDDPEFAAESLQHLEATKAEVRQVPVPAGHWREGYPSPFRDIQLRIMEIQRLPVALPDGVNAEFYPMVSLQRMKRAGFDLETAAYVEMIEFEGGEYPGLNRINRLEPRVVDGVLIEMQLETLSNTSNVPEIILSFGTTSIRAYVYDELREAADGYRTIYRCPIGRCRDSGALIY